MEVRVKLDQLDRLSSAALLSDVFGVNGRHGRRTRDGLAAGHPPRVILAGLT